MKGATVERDAGCGSVWVRMKAAGLGAGTRAVLLLMNV